MIKKYKINENECGYLIRRGRFEKLLTVGTYYFLSLSGCEVKIVPMTGAVNTCGIPEEILMKNPEFASRVVKKCASGYIHCHPVCKWSVQRGGL